MLGLWDDDITYSQAVYTYAMELQNSPSTKYMTRNKDGSLSKERLKAVTIMGGTNGTPGNNQAQNKQAQDAANKYKLSKEGKRLLHDTITGQGYSQQQIANEAKAIAELGGKYVR